MKCLKARMNFDFVNIARYCYHPKKISSQIFLVLPHFTYCYFGYFAIQVGKDMNGIYENGCRLP